VTLMLERPGRRLGPASGAEMCENPQVVALRMLGWEAHSGVHRAVMRRETRQGTEQAD
jgi:hypothetical protein